MREAKRSYELLSQLTPGKVYSWNNLKAYSNSMSRDLKRLLDEGKLEKVGPGLYSHFKMSRFGKVPPDDSDLVKAFLKSEDFLMFSVNLYNSLGVGLTQLKNETVVYNKKRYEPVVLLGREFNFKRPNNGYPNKLTKEFLLVDLMNNLKSVGEEPSKVKEKVADIVVSNKFNVVVLYELSKKYGKVSTKKFFRELLKTHE